MNYFISSNFLKYLYCRKETWAHCIRKWAESLVLYKGFCVHPNKYLRQRYVTNVNKRYIYIRYVACDTKCIECTNKLHDNALQSVRYISLLCSVLAMLQSHPTYDRTLLLSHRTPQKPVSSGPLKHIKKEKMLIHFLNSGF